MPFRKRTDKWSLFRNLFVVVDHDDKEYDMTWLFWALVAVFLAVTGLALSTIPAKADDDTNARMYAHVLICSSDYSKCIGKLEPVALEVWQSCEWYRTYASRKDWLGAEWVNSSPLQVLVECRFWPIQEK